ncbi:MAG: hypothetical protein E7381_01965 [Clostridiales bacterium]|nr:hypothetical protein [Clostridiales bacterium]
MKKKLLSIFSLTLALAFTLGATGCDFFDIDNDGSSNDSGDSSSSSSSTPGATPTSDEEIFTAVKEAVFASMAYDGAYTLTREQTQTMNGQTMSAVGVYSADPATKRAGFRGADPYDDGYVGKVFEKDSEYYYFYQTSPSNPSSSSSEFVEYYAITEREAMEYVIDEMPNENLDGTTAFTLAENFASVQSAYDTVATASLAQLQEEYPTMQGGAEVSVEQTDGVSVLQVSLNSSITGEEARDMTTTYRFSAKDGKIVGIEMKAEGTFVDTEGHYGEEGEEVSIESLISFAYEYSFDQELFDSITPCEPSEEESNESVSIDFHVAGQFYMHGYAGNIEGRTAEELFDNALRDAFAYQWEDGSYSFDKWYLDEACTQEFVLSEYTAEELAEIEDLYAKTVTISDGYALVAEDYVEENKQSLAYQIVEGTGMSFGGKSNMKHEPRMIPAGNSVSYSMEGYDELRVNGESTTETTWTCESGKVYFVERVRYYKDEDFNLFEVFLEI